MFIPREHESTKPPCTVPNPWTRRAKKFYYDGMLFMCDCGNVFRLNISSHYGGMDHVYTLRNWELVENGVAPKA